MAESSGVVEIACSLTDEEMRNRRALVRKQLIPHILKTEETQHGLVLRFSESDEVRSEVERFVSLERQCCGFLTFSITQPISGLELTIEGPEEAGAVIRSFINGIRKS